MTIHDDIDNWLAADLHHDLSEPEREALTDHLIECAACRKLRQETKVMNTIVEENLATKKPDTGFEQRMLTGFRDRVPERTTGIITSLIHLMQWRATQVAAVAAVLLGLVQVGRILTHEETPLAAKINGVREERSETQRAPGASSAIPLPQPESNGGISRSQSADSLAAKKPSADTFTDASAMQRNSVASRAAHALAKEANVGSAAPAPTGGTAADRQKDIAPVAPETGGLSDRKLIRNATVDLEIASFDDAVQKITVFANEERGYVATTSSQKQANGKLRGELVVKVLPENLDRFLQKLRGLGDLKNQTLGTQDITKAFFDTDARLKNARVMEQRLVEMLKKRSDDISDLLQVEKELGRVREQIEQMQGELKFWDSQVQFATVTISLAEKEMEEPAAFLLKERAQLGLYAADVEKVYNQIKALASPKTQITNAQLDRDQSGRVSARISVLIAPEESDGQIARIKEMGRVENFQVQTERVAQGGTGMSENARTKRDKVELNITVSREEQEQAFQQTNLRIRTGSVDDKTKALSILAQEQNGRVRSSSFARDTDGREFANVSVRVPMKNYKALMHSLGSLGQVENVTVQRQDRTGGKIDEANAPADVSIQVYSQGNIVSHESGLIATLRRTLSQSAAGIMWSIRMIGVAIAFLVPWILALAAIIWVIKRIIRARS